MCVRRPLPPPPPRKTELSIGWSPSSLPNEDAPGSQTPWPNPAPPAASFLPPVRGCLVFPSRHHLSALTTRVAPFGWLQVCPCLPGSKSRFTRRGLVWSRRAQGCGVGPFTCRLWGVALRVGGAPLAAAVLVAMPTLSSAADASRRGHSARTGCLQATISYEGWRWRPGDAPRCLGGAS